MKSRYFILPYENLNIVFFSSNMKMHKSYILTYNKKDLNELFGYCRQHYITAFAMSKCRGYVEDLKEIDDTIGNYQIRMTTTQLSYLGCVLIDR